MTKRSVVLPLLKSLNEGREDDNDLQILDLDSNLLQLLEAVSSLR